MSSTAPQSVVFSRRVVDDDGHVGPVQRALILRTFQGFSGLDGNEIAVLASITQEKTFRAGEVIHEPGKPVTAFYLIVTGEVQSYRDGLPSKVFGPRSSIGGLASLTQDPKGNHAVAITDVLALEVHSDDMQDVFEDNYNVLLGVLRALAMTLRDAQKAAGGGAAVTNAASGATKKAKLSKDRLNLVERMFVYRQTSNFGYASIEALADLVHESREERYEPGDCLWKAGEPANVSVLIVEGEIECHAEDMPPFSFGHGFVVGGLGSLAKDNRWYSAYAKTPLRVMSMQRAHLFDVLEDHIDMAMELMRNLAQGVQAILTRLARQSEMPPPLGSGEGEEADE